MIVQQIKEHNISAIVIAFMAENRNIAVDYREDFVPMINGDDAVAKQAVESFLTMCQEETIPTLTITGKNGNRIRFTSRPNQFKERKIFWTAELH